MAKNIDIPNGWEVKKLGEIGNFLKGKGIKKDELCDNGLPCVIYGQIYTSYDFYTDKFTSFIPINLKPYTTEIYQNDILFAGSGETKEEIGKSIAYIGKECAYAGGDIIILRQDKVISIFITYYLNSIGRKHLNRLGQGDSVVHIYKSILESVKIPVPPLAEQEKIAEILSLWDKAIEHTKELIAYKEKQKKGLMQNLLTGKKRLHGFNDKWKTYIVKELGLVITGKTPNTEKNEYYGDEFLFITPTDIHYKYTTKTERNLSKSGLNKSKLIPKNSVLITCIASIGKNTINKSDCAINQQINAIVPNNNFYYEYIYYYMTFNSPYLLKFAGKSATSIINKTTFEEIDVTIPPLDEQKAIADILCKADEEIELLNKQLDLYTEQKKGLMQNLLTGKVRVKV